MDDNKLVYNSPIKHSPKKRLERIVAGLLYALHEKYPLLSTEERRMWLGLVICRNRQQLVNQTLSTLEMGR